MATIRTDLDPDQAQFLATVFPQYDKVNGTSFPVTGLRFDASLDEAAFWRLDAFAYGSGNLTCTVIWTADTQSSNATVWEAAIAAITAGTDSQDVTTKAFATAQTVTSSHLGTTVKRLMTASITISNLDSIAADDIVWLRIKRLGSNGSDSMTGDAWLLQARLSYSDT